MNKTKKKYKNKIIKLFNLIKKKINGNIEIKVLINKESNVDIKNKKIENIEFKKNNIIKINVYYKKHKCGVIINNFKKKIVLECIKYIKNTIKYTPKDKYKLPNIKTFKQKYEKNLGINFKDNISIKEMINISKNIEKNSININKKIKSNGTSFIKKKTIFFIYNDNKILKYYINKYYIIIHNLIIKYKNIMEQDTDYICSHKLSDIITKYHFISKNLTKKILKKIKQKEIKTQITSVIFSYESKIEIFKWLISSINGNNIYNKTSWLYKKKNKKILPKWIDIIENPYIYKGIGTKPFDLNGLNTKKYYIIKKGILKNWILDLYYSKKLNEKNTCNSGGIHNWIFYNRKKQINFKELIKIMNNGIIIDKLIGQGVNINNGFYSKGISGWFIKKKKIKFYFNEATISGNMKNLYKNIIYMSNDINIYSNIRSGSILVKNIQITGK